MIILEDILDTSVHPWRRTYGGVQAIEALMDEICERFGLQIEMECETNTKGFRKRVTTVPPSDQLQQLTLTIKYTSPLADIGIIFQAFSPISGKTSMKTEDPALILTAISTLVSTHDSEAGKWISFKK